MSMLSAQCDKLRERAKVLRQGRWSDGADDARLMEDAADTIWELRGMVHKERAEADRLREERDMYRDLVDHMVHPDIPDQLAAENVKLRELVRDMADWAYISDYCDLEEQFADRMRELGVEVE